MTTLGGWTKKRILITVRTYPTPARNGVEVSCTAGITEEGEWIRLFPVPYRFLAYDRRFTKYQLIEVDVQRSSDPRPESYRINPDSIKILEQPLSTKNYWSARKDRVFPLRANSLCELQRLRDQNGHPTLGLFKPKEVSFRLQPEDNPDWTPNELERLSQSSFFDNTPSQLLEKVPYKFYYRFRCDDRRCNLHNLSCTDWEMGESYRKWRNEYGSDGWLRAFRNKYEVDMLLDKDLHFYVGTVRLHPGRWIIVGLFYPKLSPPKLPGFC